jgi:hypothetical protein
MMTGNQLKARIEKMLPGSEVQYGYHGCNKASVQVFHGASGHGSGKPLVDWNCRSENWGNGRLNAKPSEIVAAAKANLK